jgi:hypothetical protein
VTLQTLTTAPTTLDLDELRLVTLPPTASVCPAYVAQTVSASGGDVALPVTILNPTSQPRSYRVFLSSEIGLDRQTLEIAMHDTDDVAAVDDLQGGVGADGGLGAAELFARDAGGNATGASIVSSATSIPVAAGGAFQGLLVHHVQPAMLGAPQSVAADGHIVHGPARHADDELDRVGSVRAARRRHFRGVHGVERRQRPPGAAGLPALRRPRQRLDERGRTTGPGGRVLRVRVDLDALKGRPPPRVPD